jgi:hypothetical protein
LISLKLTPSSSLLVLHESGHSGPAVIDAGDVAAAILLQQLCKVGFAATVAAERHF